MDKSSCDCMEREWIVLVWVSCLIYKEYYSCVLWFRGYGNCYQFNAVLCFSDVSSQYLRCKCKKNNIVELNQMQ